MTWKWWRRVLVEQQEPLDEGLMAFYGWLKDLVSQYRDKILGTAKQYRGKPEEAIVHAAAILGIGKSDLERRARAVSEARLDEGWFSDFVDWWSRRVKYFIQGVDMWVDDRGAMACTIIVLGALGLITAAQLPILTKIVVWLYAFYLIDKAGR